MIQPSYDLYRNVCPRNCYGSCGLLSYVQAGRLVKVAGDPKHGFCQGHLCAKGYASTQYVYHEERLKTPLLQTPRGSGNWLAISWEEAYERIATKILQLYQRYGNHLSLGYNMFCGNLGQLQQAVPAMFNSLGAHTKPDGNICLATGLYALQDQIGVVDSPAPEAMASDQLIVIWGGNPAHTDVQQMYYLYAARRQGAQLVVIDPLFTATAAKADLYIQIRPGTDGYLALCLLKILWKENHLDPHRLHSIDGWDSLSRYLEEKIELAQLERVTGVSAEAAKLLAQLYATASPVSTWVGFGLQRHANGGQNVRAIHSLSQLIAPRESKFYYCHTGLDLFPNPLRNHPTPQPQDEEKMRYLDLSHFAREALALQDPPLKFLWIASRNPWTQDQHLGAWERLWNQLEMVVTVDLYMTETARRSDLVLPTTSYFEQYDCVVSYWHHWLALNEPALPPFYEAKSDLQIARELTAYLNQLAPDFSNFPSQLTAEDWLTREISPEVCELYGIDSWEELRQGPRPLQWEVYQQRVAEQKGEPDFTLFSAQAKAEGRPALPIYLKPKWEGDEYPFQVFTPQALLRCHSQYEQLPWLDEGEAGQTVTMHPRTAASRNLAAGDEVALYNEEGMVNRRVRFDSTLPQNLLVTAQGGESPINHLVAKRERRGQRQQNRFRLSGHFYDLYVEMKKIEQGGGR